jgi:hypothetical protein
VGGGTSSSVERDRRVLAWRGGGSEVTPDGRGRALEGW